MRRQRKPSLVLALHVTARDRRAARMTMVMMPTCLQQSGHTVDTQWDLAVIW